MRKWLGLLLLCGLPLAVWGQTDTLPEFRPMLRRLWYYRLDKTLSGEPPAFALPVVYRDSTYGPDKHKQLKLEVRLAAGPLLTQHRVVKLASPGYPVCYSVVFDNCLVALFKNGKFNCYRLPDLTPDERLARQLNLGGWLQCWLLGGKLVAQNDKGYFAYDAAARAWQPYEQPVPFGKRPKLYEDARYLAYADCQGEFGGTVSFYDKQTGRTHALEATCANSVWQEAGQYYVLASLGHMMGSAGCVALTSPAQLPPAARPGSSQRPRAAAPAPRVVTDVFSFYGLQLFGGLRWQNQTLYLMRWRHTTFLVTIAGRRITIVDPLFADDLYTFNPVTTTYGPGLALTNLNSNNEPATTEVAALLWQGGQLTKVEWGH